MGLKQIFLMKRSDYIFKKKITKIIKPNLIKLKKYKIAFTTLDGKEHEFNRLDFIDDNTICCSVGEYYLIGEKYLEDDEGNIYPIDNVQKIRFELVDSIENVVEKHIGGGIRYVWYPREMIEIYSDES